MIEREENADVETACKFEFDLDQAIRDQVVEKLERSPLMDLQQNVGPKQSGIYALYHKGRLVYVGKASKVRRRAGVRCAQG